MTRKLAFVLIVVLLGVPPSITALGLGNITSDSALNEPLSARIRLLSMQGEDASSIHVSLASPAAFQSAGLDRPFYLSRLNFQVKQVGGQNYIYITTEKPLKEPFLDFLLDVRSPQGELVREYTVFLDPPQYFAGKPLTSGSHTMATRALAQSSAAVSSPSLAEGVAVAGGTRKSGAASTRYGPVQANQTLWSIANEVRPEGGVTIYQTMQALLQDNPGAFIDGNINAIMKGAVLRVPPRAEIARIDAGEAARQMQGQLDRWHRNHAGSAHEAPSAQASTQTPSAGQANGSGAEAASSPVEASTSASARGHLKVTAPTQQSAEQQGTPSLADQPLAPTKQNILRLQQQLVLMQEHNAGLKSANEQLQQQANSLKKELINLESVVNLQLKGSVPLAAAGASAAKETKADTAQEGAIAGSPDKATSAKSPASKAPAQSKAPESGTSAQTDSAGKAAPVVAQQPQAQAKPGAAAQAKHSTASQTQANAPRTKGDAVSAKPQSKPPAQQAAKLSRMGQLLSYLHQDPKRLVLIILGLLLVILLVFWEVRRRRGTFTESRKSQPETLASGIGAASGAALADKAASASGHAGPHPQAAAVGESNPLDEVEAYLAYGRYEQAQELLDHALGENPDNIELRVKLLEVLAVRGDRSGFEAEAQVLRTQITDESDPRWQRVIELARDIAPGHPLFGDEPTVDTEATAAQPQQWEEVASSDTFEPATQPPPQALETELDSSTEGTWQDQAGNLPEDDMPETDESEQDGSLEFDLGELEAFMSEAKEDAASVSQGSEERDDDLGLLDFSLPEDRETPEEGLQVDHSDQDSAAPELETPSGQPAESTAESDATAEDLDSLDEVGTKLDLARAYLDMGDADGAKSLLKEVVAEGNAAQRGEAQDMLRQVS